MQKFSLSKYAFFWSKNITDNKCYQYSYSNEKIDAAPFTTYQVYLPEDQTYQTSLQHNNQPHSIHQALVDFFSSPFSPWTWNEDNIWTGYSAGIDVLMKTFTASRLHILETPKFQ